MPIPTPSRMFIETDSLNGIARGAVSRVYDQGKVLEELGAFLREALGEMHEFETPEDLSGKAIRLRVVAEQASRVLLDVQRLAGKLEALAEVRSSIESESP